MAEIRDEDGRVWYVEHILGTGFRLDALTHHYRVRSPDGEEFHSTHSKRVGQLGTEDLPELLENRV